MQKTQKKSFFDFVRKNGKQLFCWSALVLNIVLVLCFFQAKNNFHIDELFSFGHANSTQGAFLVPQITKVWSPDEYPQHLWNRWIPGTVFHHWLTVQPHEKFRYKSIVDNLALDVHPPLFYFLLHTVCSLTPDVMSKWQGAVVNIPLWLLLLWLLFRLANLFFKDSFYAWCVVLFFAYSEAGFASVLFIRGYLLQTVCAVWLVDLVTRLLKENKAGRARLVCIGCAATLGMLTHYNSVVFAALVGIVAGLILCARKQWKLCAELALTLTAGFMVFVTLFPPAWDLFLNSAQRQEALSQDHLSGRSLLAFLFGLNEQIKEYLTRFWHSSEHYWMLVYIAGICTLSYKYLKTNANRLIDWLVCLIVLVWIYLAMTMPDMWKFQIRYTMLLYPLLSLVTVWYLLFLIAPLMRPPKKKQAGWMIGALIFINAWGGLYFEDFSAFAFHHDFPYQVENVTGKRLVFQGSIFTLFNGTDLWAHTKEVFWIPDENPDLEKFEEALDGADMFLRQYDGPEYGLQNSSKTKRLFGLRSLKHGNSLYEEYMITDIPPADAEDKTEPEKPN